MGNCVCSSANQKYNKYRQKFQAYDKEPVDTQNYKENIQKLPFSAVFANVKLKKCPYKSIGVKISIDEDQYYQLANKTVYNAEDIKWKIQKRIDFLKSQYDLRKSFVNITMIDQSQFIVSRLKINLFLICTGPYHQDFFIEFKNGKNGRISFDFKISQLIQVKLESLFTEINLFKQHPGQKFSFSIKTIVSNDAQISALSYPVVVMLDQKNPIKVIQQDFIQIQTKRKNSKNSLTKINEKELQQLKVGQNLIWSKDVCQQIPSLNLKVLFSELHHSYFQILLIRYDQKLQEIKHQLFAQCYISFHRLFSIQPTVIQIENKIFQQRMIDIKQKLWIHGKETGNAKFKFSIKNQKYIKQMQICVRTEEGILKTSPIFDFAFDQSRYQKDSCQQIQEIQKLRQQIEKCFIQLQDYENGKNYLMMRKLRNHIQQNLQQMIPLLQKTSKQSLICFTYSSPNEMMKAQKIFIDIGFQTILYLEQEKLDEVCWQILIALIKRGEFMLNHIGFDETCKKQIQNQPDSKLSKFTKQKIEVAQMYQQFLYKLLQLALKSLNVKGSQSQRAFAELFCSYAYFRIPDFRKEMLKIIVKQEDGQVPQWRGIQFSLNQDIDYTVLREDVNSFSVLFDWEHNFHKCIKKKQNKMEQLQLSDILSVQDWKKRFHKRGPAFFSFIKYWVMYIQGIVVKSKDIQWKYFPGYNKLLKAFFLQMKRRPLLEYPDCLKETSKKLTSNEKIIKTLIMILFNKSNIYQPYGVIKVIDFISQLFAGLQSKNKGLPNLFDYSFFFKGLKIMLESQFIFVIQAAIIMIYNHFQFFHIQFRKNLAIYLLTKVFFRLFLHWSHSVRYVFYHFIIYRIYKEINFYVKEEFMVSNLTMKKEFIANVKPHYDRAMLMLQNARQIKKQQVKGRIILEYQKDLYKIMKKKLNNKKRNLIKNNLLSPKKKNQLDNDFPASDNQKTPKIVTKKNNQFSFERLIQPRVERVQSEYIGSKTQIQHLYKVKSGKKQEEVIKLTKPNSFTLKNEILDTTQVNQSNSKGNPRKISITDASPIFNVFQNDEKNSQIEPIKMQQTQYLQVCSGTFQDVFGQYQKNISLGKTQNPKIKRQQAAIDQKELMPQKIDDW